MKQILLEYLPFKYDAKALNESTTNSRFIVKGVLQRAGAKNQNGRIYPRPVLEREIDKYKKTLIAEYRALGELDHPDSNIINLRNVSHNIIDVSWSGDDVIGTVEILSTPSGNILKELFKSGITVGISSRGLGSVKQLDESTVEVQDDFELICWDFVSDPSTQQAYMRPVNESRNIHIKTNLTETANALIRDIICELSGVCCITK